MPYAYLVRCKDGSYYAGWTTDLKRRLFVHNKGCGAKYTRSRLPVELVWWQEFAEKGAAMAQEAALKKLSRAAKEELVQNSKLEMRRSSDG